MRKYEIIICWSDDDQAFIAEVPELPGCMAHGDTQEDALMNAKRASSYGLIRLLNSGIMSRNPRDTGCCLLEMAIPDFQTIMLPLLVSDKKGHSTQEITKVLAVESKLDKEILRFQPLPPTKSRGLILITLSKNSYVTN